MSRLIALSCFWLLAACSTLSCADELTPEKIRDIKALMSIGMPKEADLAVFTRQADQGFQMLKRQQPQLSDQTLKSMREEAIRVFELKRDEPGGLTDRLVAVYHKHLSHDDVKQILQFFETPVGQNVKAFLAVRQRDAQPIIDQWGQEVAREWARSMFEILMKEAMPPPTPQ